MLTLTENASTIVRDITSQEGFPENGGLRISSEGGEPSGLTINAAEQPQPEDQVIEQEGATVYLDQDAAQLLDDKVLDAAVDTEGRVEFAIGIAP